MNGMLRALVIAMLCIVGVQRSPLLAQEEGGDLPPPEEQVLPEVPATMDPVPASTPAATESVPARTPIPTSPGKQIVTFPSSRPGVTLRLMIGTPAAPPTAVLLQF